MLKEEGKISPPPHSLHKFSVLSICLFWAWTWPFKIRASGWQFLGQKILIFNDRIGVLASIFTCRHSNPLGGVFSSLPEPLYFRQLFENFSQ